MSIKLTGDQYIDLDGKLAEIKRQMRQQSGYPYDPGKLNTFLQRAIEGKWEKIPWIEKDNIIYFTLVSNGRSGINWVKYFESDGRIKFENGSEKLLWSEDFRPNKGGSLYNIAVIKGNLFSDDKRTLPMIIERADELMFGEPNIEVSCLISNAFTGGEIEDIMGLRGIVVMHEPLKHSVINEARLEISAFARSSSLSAVRTDSGYVWPRGTGFAFVYTQVIA